MILALDGTTLTKLFQTTYALMHLSPVYGKGAVVLISNPLWIYVFVKHKIICLDFAVMPNHCKSFEMLSEVLNEVLSVLLSYIRTQKTHRVALLWGLHISK